MSIIYVTTHEQKARVNILFRSKTFKTHQVEGYKQEKKTSGLFFGPNWALTLAPAIVWQT